MEDCDMADTRKSLAERVSHDDVVDVAIAFDLLHVEIVERESTLATEYNTLR
ncbi:unnamed protein product, partial [marine sediment metagenome]